ncbi:MAG: ATP-dependent zinc metalloprotease FtsH [Calditrichaeota bacterium]|nr:ATP-dependent zinc metalloprotease FtsH [Calditrichota bacterium]
MSEKQPKNNAPKKPQPAPAKKFNFSLWYLVAVLLALFIAQAYMGGQHYEKLSYSKFKELLKDDQIKNVVITQENIRGDAMLDSAGVKVQTPFEAVRVEDPDLVKQLEEKGIDFEGRFDSDWLKGLFFAWILPLGIIFLIWSFLIRRMGGGGTGGLMSFGKSRAKVYVESTTKINFSDVAGIDEAVEELKEVVDFLKHPAKFRALGAQIPKGVMLVGPPGTGKTLLAKAVAGEAHVPFFSISGSDFVEMFVGVGAARVRDLFAQAAAKAPCIVFIDELDALGKARGANPWASHDEREQTLNALLVEMDGFESSKGVIIMAATNRPEILDMALMRPGRFDRQVVVDPPNIDGREAILRVHAKGKKFDKDVNLRVIAARTPGFAGADLANSINEAALLAARRGKKLIGQRELEEAVDREMTGLERRSRVMTPKVKEKIAYHECGHALVGAKLPDTDPIHRVSIIPRGTSTLGHTLYLPAEEQVLITKQEIIDKIKVALGGRAAEELIYGEITSGAYSDLQQVTGMARAMIMDYGMSEKLGQVVYRKRGHGMQGNPFQAQDDYYGEKTAEAIDQEVRELIDTCYDEAKQILSENIDVLKDMTAELLKVEILEGDALAQFLGKDRITDYSEHMNGAPIHDEPEHQEEETPSDDEEDPDVGQNLDREG